MNSGATAPSGKAETDREAAVIGQAIAYPRQADAASFARRALAIWKGAGQLTVLEATDLHPADTTQPAARVVVRIHFPAVVSQEAFGDSRPALDACYRLEYAEPSSSLTGEPQRVNCPAGAVAAVLPPAAPVEHLPTDAAARLQRVLEALPDSVTSASVTEALRAAFPAYVVVDGEVEGHRMAGAVSVPHPDGPDCEIAVRDGARVEPVRPSDPIVLMSGESGCVADLGLHPVVVH